LTVPDDDGAGREPTAPTADELADRTVTVDTRDGGSPSGDVVVTEASPSDFVAVMRVLEGALIDVEATDVRTAIAAGDALVAGRGGRVVGALVLGTRPPDAPAAFRGVVECDPVRDPAPARDGTHGDGSSRSDRTDTPATDPRRRLPDTRPHVVALAVERTARRQGIGEALVAAAADRVALLTVDCRPDVAEFYEAVGAVTTVHDGRVWGRLRGDGGDGEGSP
jgi:ribosomal protein S18 acetylase RimI-like enzyme